MKMSKPYFSHDIDARGDLAIKDLIFNFGWEGYGLYWAIVEFMHENNFPTNRLPVIARDLHIEVDLLKKIMEETNLFYIQQSEDGNEEYISDRILRNLELQQEKSKKNKKAAAAKWEKYRQNQSKPEILELTPEEKKLTIDIISYYSSVFKKEYISSEETDSAIIAICRKNTSVFSENALDKWKEIIDEANKGWDYPDNKHEKPNFKYILKNWNAILSKDCNFAEDKEAIKKENEAKKKLENEAKKKLDSGIDTALFVYDDYRCSSNVLKLEAQKIYTSKLEETNDEQEAIKATCLYCRGQKQDE